VMFSPIPYLAISGTWRKQSPTVPLTQKEANATGDCGHHKSMKGYKL
jgi:hypothetical protein